MEPNKFIMCLEMNKLIVPILNNALVMHFYFTPHQLATADIAMGGCESRGDFTGNVFISICIMCSLSKLLSVISCQLPLCVVFLE